MAPRVPLRHSRALGDELEDFDLAELCACLELRRRPRLAAHLRRGVAAGRLEARLLGRPGAPGRLMAYRVHRRLAHRTPSRHGFRLVISHPDHGTIRLPYD